MARITPPKPTKSIRAPKTRKGSLQTIPPVVFTPKRPSVVERAKREQAEKAAQARREAAVKYTASHITVAVLLAVSLTLNVVAAIGALL